MPQAAPPSIRGTILLRAHNKHCSYLACLSLVTVLLTCASVAHAADLYLVRFNAVSRENLGITLIWHDQAIFFNSGSSPATVRVLGVSEGQPARGAADSFS